MRLLSTNLVHIGRFAQLSLDLTQIPDEKRIVAFIGTMGAGKSTVLESLTGAPIARKFATHGTLAKMATDKDSMLETRFEYGGGTWRIKHLLNGKKGEAYIEGPGVACESTGRDDFDATVKKELPPLKLLYNTIWRAQLDKGFLGLDESERQDLILLATGASHFEGLSSQARKNATAAESEAASLLVRIDDEVDADADRVDELEFELLGHEQAALDASNEVAKAQAALDTAKAANADAVLARQLYEEKLAAYRKLASSREVTSRVLADLKARLAAADPVVLSTRVDDARKALTKAETELAAAEQMAKDYAVRRQAAKAATEARDRLNEQITTTYEKVKADEKRIQANKGLLAKASEIRAVIAKREAAKAALPILDGALKLARGKVEAAQQALDALSADQLVGAEERIDTLRQGLSEVRTAAWHLVEGGCYSADAIHETADSTLLKDDATVAATIEHPRKVLAGRHALHEAQKEQAAIEQKRAAASADAVASHPHELPLSQAEARIAELTRAVEAAGTEIRDLQTRLAAMPAPEVVPGDPDVASLRKALQYAKAAHDAAIAARAASDATILELSPAIFTKTAELEALETELSAAQEPVPPAEVPGLADLTEAFDAASKASMDAQAELGAARQRVAFAKDAADRVAELRHRLARQEQELSDWTRLANDLGRDGIQAVLVDAAGPEMSETANRWLATCFGTRWSLEISTQRLSADKKKTIEECEVIVHDAGDESQNAPPRTGNGESYSGGEQGVINEALALALTRLARNAGLVNPDLVRDESGSSLPFEYRHKWVDMLRLAADEIGARHVYLVSHSEDVHRLADAQVIFEGSRVRIAA